MSLPRDWDPNAVGASAYNGYTSLAGSDDYSIHGVSHDLVDLNEDHAILRDYHGDTLYTTIWTGAAYRYLPDDVDALASFPNDIWNNDPDEDLHVWRFKPVQGIVDTLIKILDLFIDGITGEIPIDDLPPEWQELLLNDPEWQGVINGLNIDLYKFFMLVNERFPCWYQEPDFIETKVQNLPCIIAFDNGNGRVILSSPHIAGNITSEDVEITESKKTEAQNIRAGLYHWKYRGDEDDEWLHKDDDTDYNTDLWWYQRREAAWASNQTPDDHLPPVYNRSHVVDIDPYRQESEMVDIECCVAKEKGAWWDWNTTGNFPLYLTLYYKFFDSGTWTDWTNWSSIYGRPYNFTFDASDANGSGYYRFCSILDVNGTVDEFPPEPDAVVAVDTSIESYFESTDNNYIYAKKPIQFDSSKSSTKSGTNITGYQWQFGDGEESTDSNPTHTYDDEYYITLTVENDLESQDDITKKITVHNNFPEADFEPGYKMVFVGETVNLTDNSSDIDGNLSQWYWDFRDGSNSTIQNTNHSYSESGYYQVSLEVTDDDNDTDSRVSGILVIDSLVNQSKTPTNNIWNKVQDAVDNSSANDIIYIENGTYSENININKSISIFGEDRDNVVITGSMSMVNPRDYELPDNHSIDLFIPVNMTGNELLMHFNNDSDVGENYFTSDLVYDYSGEENNGTNYGALWTTSSIKGAGAFDFNGTNSSINLSSIPGFTGENVTASAWVFWTNGSGTADPIISQSNATQGYCLYVNSSSGEPVFRLDGDEATSSIPLSSNEWHHIVGTHNTTTLKIYIDGKCRGTSGKNGSGFDTDCFIGFDNVSGYFDGMIDEVAVWNRTLTNDEIRLIYNSNNGLSVAGFTFQDSEIGISVCNHSEISYCHFINHTLGISMDNSSDVRINMCNITDAETGIKIVDSNPDSFYFNRIVDCVVDNVTSGITVNNSSYLSIVRTSVNGSSSNLTFSNCNFSSISVIHSDSPGNVAPHTPYLSGPTLGEINTSYTFSTVTNDSNNDQIRYRFDWGDGNDSGWLSLYTSNETVNDSHTWMEPGNYNVRVKAMDVFDDESSWAESLFIIDTLPPVFNSIDNSPDIVGFGGNISIIVNATDDENSGCSGVQTVKVNVTSPDNVTLGNFTMSFEGDSSYEYVFSDNWVVGQYNYSIWACDNASNSNNSYGYCFNVSAEATVSVCTVKDVYGDNETVNLTDPPGPSEQLIGYELLDDDQVLRIWNQFDSYYFNTSNGVQFTNHKDDYWSHNVLMLGYYSGDVWNLIYRNDNLSGFNKDIESDDETYVNATLWKNLNYSGYDFRLAVWYHLGVDDNELTVIPYIKNIDDENISYILGFGWEINNIRVDMTPSGDYIEINNSMYYLNGSIDETYTNLSQPCYYIRENITGNTFESLYLRWNNSLNYKIKVESRDGEYNAPVTLGIKIGTLNIGQEKYTKMFWHDASEIIYYFNSYDTNETWSSNPGYMVDGNIGNYALTSLNGDVEFCDNNTCPGTDLGVISKVELRVYGYYSGSQNDIVLRPVFNGTKDGGNYTTNTEPSPGWSDWFDITGDLPISSSNQWAWSDVDTLGCDVEAEIESGMSMFYCSKVEVRVTYNQLPVISNPYPADGSTGIPLTPTLNITVVDPDSDLMNIDWLSNSSGSWQVFGTNNSVGNGTYHQTMVNASVNGQWWYWKVNVSDEDGCNESDVYKFYTGNQSLIENTGSKAIKGYLLIQVQYYNTSIGEWVVANDTINETSVRTINGSLCANCNNLLGLDTIFNGNVNTSDLLSGFGGGSYRIYAAFRDPDGDVLVCDDESLMEATYEFTVSSS